MAVSTIHIDIEGGWGGSSRSLFELVKRLNRGRVAPVIIHRQLGPLTEWYATIGVPTYHLADIGSFVPRREKALKNFLASCPGLLRLNRAADQIATIARHHGSAVIHLNYEGLFLLAEHLRNKLSLPLIGHSRAYLPMSWWGRWLVRKLSSRVDHMFFISPQEQARWAELGGASVPGEVLWNISRNPLPRGSFADPPEVVFLGNLQPSKGADRIIEIASVLKRRGAARFTFAIYGKPRSNSAIEKRLKEHCEHAAVSDWVEFRGHTPEPESVLSRAFALVRPSYENDPWGRDVIEAIAAGVPVFATGRFDGVVRPGLTGYLFDPFDPECIADELVALRADPGHWQRMSSAGQAFAREHFGGAAQAEQFTRVVERLASVHPRSVVA